MRAHFLSRSAWVSTWFARVDSPRSPHLPRVDERAPPNPWCDHRVFSFRVAMFASYSPLWLDWCDRVARPPSNEIAARKSTPTDVPFALAVFRIRCPERIMYFSIRSARSANDRVCNSTQLIPSSMWSPNRASGWCDGQRMPADPSEIAKRKAKTQNWSSYQKRMVQYVMAMRWERMGRTMVPGMRRAM